MQRILGYTLMGLWFTTLISNPTHSNHETKHATQPHAKNEVNNAAQLLQSIQRDLQDYKYRQDILPNNFSYLMQLLQHGEQTKQTREFAQESFSLFSKVLKGSEYVNSYAFNSFIERLPALLKHYFAGPQLESANQLIIENDLSMLERLQQAVTSIVYSKFTQDFNTCKTNPEQFLNDLTHKIVSATAQEVTTEQLRQIVIRFLEVGLSKLIWNPNDQEKTWESVKSISHHLATLMKSNIIDDLNDMDELYWTLVHRYRYFLELHHTSMPFAFYTKIKQDIRTQKLMLFELEEQEPFLQTKASCLMQTVLMQEAKKRSQEYHLPTGQRVV